MTLLGLVEGGSRAGQGGQSNQITTQDQATSPIVIVLDDVSDDNDERTPEESNRAVNTQDNLGDQASVQENESRNSSGRSSRQTSPRVTREQERFQGLLQELSTPAKGEQAEVNVNDNVGISTS